MSLGICQCQTSREGFRKPAPKPVHAIPSSSLNGILLQSQTKTVERVFIKRFELQYIAVTRVQLLEYEAAVSIIRALHSYKEMMVLYAINTNGVFAIIAA